MKNIYPQVDGMPVYNSSGRYWVKLYYLGKPRKIEIDDTFPFDGFTYRCLYPMAEYGNIIWPMLLSKAISKLLSFKWRTSQDQIGEGAVMYALTGLLPRTFSIDSFKQNALIIEEALEIQSYNQNKAYVLGFCKADSKPILPSNHITRKTAFKMKARLQSSVASPLRILSSFQTLVEPSQTWSIRRTMSTWKAI